MACRPKKKQRKERKKEERRKSKLEVKSEVSLGFSTSAPLHYLFGTPPERFFPSQLFLIIVKRYREWSFGFYGESLHFLSPFMSLETSSSLICLPSTVALSPSASQVGIALLRFVDVSLDVSRSVPSRYCPLLHRFRPTGDARPCPSLPSLPSLPPSFCPFLEQTIEALRLSSILSFLALLGFQVSKLEGVEISSLGGVGRSSPPAPFRTECLRFLLPCFGRTRSNSLLIVFFSALAKGRAAKLM